MKKINFIFLILVTVITISSCNDNEVDAPSFNLSKENIIGNYEITTLDLNTEVSNEISFGIFATFSTARFVGDIFQVTLVLNSDNTYTLSGQYSVKTTISIVGAPNPTIPNSIVNFDDAGTYSIDATDNTIEFVSENINFLGATALDPIYLDTKFIVSDFNEESFTIFQESENIVDKIKTETESTIRFQRK